MGNVIPEYLFPSGDGDFDLPYGIAADGSGFVYVADTRNHRVQKFQYKEASPQLLMQAFLQRIGNTVK